jgi:hypothetical protein
MAGLPPLKEQRNAFFDRNILDVEIHHGKLVEYGF